MGKPESDLLDGNVRWVGNWEECRAVQASVNSTDGSEIIHPYSGKYCIVSWFCKNTKGKGDLFFLLNWFISLWA